MNVQWWDVGERLQRLVGIRCEEVDTRRHGPEVEVWLSRLGGGCCRKKRLLHGPGEEDELNRRTGERGGMNRLRHEYNEVRVRTEVGSEDQCVHGIRVQ